MSAANGGKYAGVFLGGTSSERSISLKSGEAVYRSLVRSDFPVIKIDPKYINPQKWQGLNLKTAFIALHGKGGEDGLIQRELEKRRIPYVGSSASASCIAFDKDKSKKAFLKHGIPTPDWVIVTPQNYSQRILRLQFPVFVKPLADGSSLGVNFVPTMADFNKRAKRLFRGESRLLVEEQVAGREITVGILGEKALPVIELKPRRVFYDYRAKYTKGMTRYLIPAPLDEKIQRKARRLAMKVHRALGLRDLSRVDIMLDKQNKLQVLEVNTIPGFTELSLLPKAAEKVGISFDDLCKKLLRFAVCRGGER